MPSAFSVRAGRITWRAILIALAYTLALVAAGGLAVALGWPLPPRADSTFVFTLVGGVCIGLTLALVFNQAPWSKWSRFVIGACGIWFTMFSTTIEGAFFAPTLVGSLPALVLLDLLAAFAVGSVALLGPVPSPAIAGATPTFSWRIRPWYNWVWRFALSAGSYLVFYWLYGALNYMLVTQSYYAAHHTALQIPPVSTLLGAEAVRGPLLALAVLPLALTTSLTRRQLAISSGAVLFIIGGVVPLLHQVGTLPAFLLVASGWEIFLQNVSLALVIAWLMGHGLPAGDDAVAQAGPTQEVSPSTAR